MRDSDAVVTGGAALLFLLDCPPPRTITFCVPHYSADYFLDYLVKTCSYGVTNNFHVPGNGNYCRVNPRSSFAGASRVVQLSRHIRDTTSRHTIKALLVVTGTTHLQGVPTVPVAFISSTLLVNYLTADGALSAYPSLTLRFRSLFHIGRMEHSNHICGHPMTMYARLGVHFRTEADNWDTDSEGRIRPCTRSWVSPCRPRSFGDAGCLIVVWNKAPLSGFGTRWVRSGIPQCNIHHDRVPEVHLPNCNC